MKARSIFFNKCLYEVQNSRPSFHFDKQWGIGKFPAEGQQQRVMEHLVAFKPLYGRLGMKDRVLPVPSNSAGKTGVPAESTSPASFWEWLREIDE